MGKTIVTLVFLHEFGPLFGPEKLDTINDHITSVGSDHIEEMNVSEYKLWSLQNDFLLSFKSVSKAMMLLHGWLKTWHFDIKGKQWSSFLSRSWWGNISPLIIKQIHQFVSLMFHSCGRNIHHLKSRVLKPLTMADHGCRSRTAELGLLAFAEGLGGAAAAFNSAHLWSQRFPFYRGRGGLFLIFFLGKIAMARPPGPPPKKTICHDSWATKYGFCMGLVWVCWGRLAQRSCTFFKNKKIIAPTKKGQLGKLDARRNSRILSASSSDICVYFEVSLRTMACQQLLHHVNVTWQVSWLVHSVWLRHCLKFLMSGCGGTWR